MTIFICGDSTAAGYPPEQAPQTGWGQLLGELIGDIPVVNCAMGGRSTKSFISEGRLVDIEEQLESTSGISFTHSTNTISTSMLEKDFDAFVDFRYKTNDDGYFYIDDFFNAGRQKLSGSNTTTEAYGYSGSLVLTITEKAMTEGAEEFEKELA